MMLLWIVALVLIIALVGIGTVVEAALWLLLLGVLAILALAVLVGRALT